MENSKVLTFKEHDRLGLQDFCINLENFLAVERDFVDGSLVVALSGGFGSGKSTFLGMWEASLLERRAKGEFLPMPVILNAWESDHCGDPLVAILTGLMEVIDKWTGVDVPKDKSKLKKAAKDAAWFAVGVGNGIAAKFAGVDAVKAAELAEKKKTARTAQGPDVLADFKKRVDALKNLKSKMASSLGGAAAKVYIFVDELDRCRPDYAVTYLETIKHVFDVPGIVFVLAVDMPHLSSSAKMLFGSQLNFDDYLRKFVHRTFRMPPLSEPALRSLSESYVSKYLVLSGKRSSYIKTDEHFQRRVVDLSVAFSLKPRQIQECFRILGHTVQIFDEDKAGQIYWAIGSAAVLLSFVRVGNPDLFYEIEKGWSGIVKISRYLKEKMGDDGLWWIRLIFSGAVSYNVREDDFIRSLNELQLFRPDGTPDGEFWQSFSQGYGHQEKQIQRIVSMIENAKSFGSTSS